MKGPLLVVMFGIIIVLLPIGMVTGVLPALVEAIRDAILLAITFIVGTGTVAYGIWIAAPNLLKRLSATALRGVPNLPNSLKRRAVKNELEGEINAAFKDFGKDVEGLIGPEIKITWLSPGEDARERFFSSGKAYLKLDFSENQERNLVEAALVYSRDYLLEATRQFLPRPLMRAIDLTFIDELLLRRNAVRSRVYFNQEVLPRELSVAPETEQYMDRLALISQHGLFIRVLWPELRDYPGHVATRLRRRSHQEQADAFIDFLAKSAQDREALTQSGLVHIGETIRVGIVLVGSPYKLQSAGTRPYVRRVALNNERGCRTVYLIGYNKGVHYVTPIAKESQRRGIAESFSSGSYDALIRNALSRQAIARLTIPEGAGRAFLEKFPDTNEWPDLEDEILEQVNGK